jgi:hypothetical protein
VISGAFNNKSVHFVGVIIVYFFLCLTNGIRAFSVGIVTRLRAGQSGFRFSTGIGDLSLPYNVPTFCRGHPAPYSVGTGGFVFESRVGVMWAYHLPVSSVEVKNQWSSTSTPHMPLWNYRDTLTLYIQQILTRNYINNIYKTVFSLKITIKEILTFYFQTFGVARIGLATVCFVFPTVEPILWNFIIIVILHELVLDTRRPVSTSSIVSSQVFQVVFIHLIYNSALLLASSRCPFLLHVIANLICMFLVSRRQVLLSTLPKFLDSFCGHIVCTRLLWKI